MRWSGLFSSRNFQGSPKLAHHSPMLESRVQTTYGTKTISGALHVFLPIFTQARAVIHDYPFDCVAHPEYLVRTHGLNPLVLVYSVRRCLSASDLLLKALLATGARVSRLYWGRPEDDPRNGKSTFDESHPMTQALIAVCPTPCWCPEEADKPAWRWLDEWAWTLGNLRQRLLGVHDRMWQALWPYHLVLQARHAVWTTLFQDVAAPCYTQPSPADAPREARPSDELVQGLREWIGMRLGNIEGLRAVGHLRYAMHGVEPRTAIQEGEGLPTAPKTRDQYLLADASPAAWRCWRWMLLILQQDPHWDSYPHPSGAFYGRADDATLSPASPRPCPPCGQVQPSGNGSYLPGTARGILLQLWQ